MRYLYLLISVLPLYLPAQICEWVKTIDGVNWEHPEVPVRTLFADNYGNVYIWGRTNVKSLISDDFTDSTNHSFIINYDEDGVFRWKKNFSSPLKSVDVDPTGIIWALTQNEIFRYTSGGLLLASRSHTATSYSYTHIKACQNGAYATTTKGIVELDVNTNVTSKREDTIPLTHVLKSDEKGIHVIGRSNSIDFDGFVMSNPYFSFNFYAVLDEDTYVAKCASMTLGGYMYSFDAAEVLSDGVYAHAGGSRYDPADLFYHDWQNNKIWTKKIHQLTNNTINSIAESGDNLYVLHTSGGGGPGLWLNLHSFSKSGDSLNSMSWENLYGTGLYTTSDAIYISGFAGGETQVGSYTISNSSHPGSKLFLAKFSMSPVGISENKITQAGAYPNPFKESTCISLNSNDPNNVRVELHDVTGKGVNARYRVIENKLMIYRDGLESGVYSCTIILGTGKKTSLKLLVN
jgi:hypothetical protein